MRKVLRFSGISLAVLLGVLVLAYLGLRIYLGSGSAKQLASEQLSQLFGGNVTVTDLDSGMGSTSVQIEVAAQPTDGTAARNQPLVKGRVSVDVSPIGLAAGSSPNTVTVEKAQVTLHFNEDGDLLDKLPSPKAGSGGGKVPDIHIKGATVHLVQKGKPDFRATGIDVSVADQGSKLAITGGGEDPTWGKWKLSGEWAADGKAGQLHLETDGKIRVTPEKLRSVPFVPTETWEVVELDGTTPFVIDVGRGADEKWWWKVLAKPEDTLARIHIIDLDLIGASGTIRVDGTTVRLEGVTGQAAGGKVKVDSVMTFGPKGHTLTYDVAVKGVDLEKLPRSWSLPKGYTGQAVGTAMVILEVRDGKIAEVKTPGNGNIKLENARILGFPADVDFPIYSDGTRIRFGPTAGKEDPPAKKDGEKTSRRGTVFPSLLGIPGRNPVRASRLGLHPEGVGVLSPGHRPGLGGRRFSQPFRLGSVTPPEPRALPWAENSHPFGVKTPPIEITDPAVAAAFLAVLLQAPSKDPPKKEEAKKDDEPTYVGANIRLRDVDLAEFLKRANVAVPVRLAGKVTFEVAAEIPVAQTGSVKAYRAKGSLSVPRLEVEGLVLENLAAALELRDGVLTLTRLGAGVPNPDGQPGSFLGTARFGIDPRTDLTADLKLTDLPLGPVLAAVPGLSGKAAGTVSGSFALKMPGDKLSDVSAVVASGKLASDGLTVFGQRADKLSLELALKDGVAELTNATADIYKGTVTGTAKVPLAGKDGGTVRVAFKDVDATTLTRSLPDFPIKLDGRFGGKLDATLPPVDDFQAAKMVGNLDLDAPRLVVQGIPTSKLTGKLGYKPGGLLTYDLKGDALGGTFDVNGSYPLGTVVEKGGAKPADPPKKDGKPPGGSVRLDRLRLDRLADALRVEGLTPLRGVITAAVDYTYGPDGLTGGGRVEVVGLGWGEELASDVTAVIRVTPDGLATDELVGRLAGGSLRGVVRIGFDRPADSVYTLTLTGADAATLLAPAGFDALEGQLNVALQGTLSREMRGRGAVTTSSAKLGGLRISTLRIPLEYAFVPNGGGQLSIRDFGGRIAGGRVTGSTVVRWGSSTRVEGQVQFFDVGLRGLLGQLGSSSGYLAGRASGRFLFRGSRVQSVNDLQGTLMATFGDAQVFGAPVFRQMAPYLSPTRSLTQFKQGDLSARLGNGAFRIDRLTLTSTNAQLFIDGLVALNGRLDLDVLANTGQIGPSERVLRLLGLAALPAIGPISLSVVTRVSEYLSNRLVRLHVGGTIERPQVSVNAVNLLTEEAIRYFLGPYAPLRTQLRQPPR